jgi:hypothetical protein
LVCDFQVRSLEAQGLPSKQAEAITGAITEVLNDSLGVVSQLVVSKGEMQKAEMTQESNLSKFKSEINSSLVSCVFKRQIVGKPIERIALLLF